MVEPTVDQVDFIDTVIEGFGAALDFGQHAAGKNTVGTEFGDVGGADRRDHRTFIFAVAQDTGDITDKNQFACAQRFGDLAGGSVGIDIVNLTVAAGTQRSYHRNTVGFKRFQNGGDIEFLESALYKFLLTSKYNSWSELLLEVAKHFEDGAKKYGENNWQKGIPTHCYIDSAVRHYLKYLRGDTDEPHDRAFVWNILCCMWTCSHHPELNDYATKDGGAK